MPGFKSVHTRLSMENGETQPFFVSQFRSEVVGHTHSKDLPGQPNIIMLMLMHEVLTKDSTRRRFEPFRFSILGCGSTLPPSWTCTGRVDNGRAREGKGRWEAARDFITAHFEPCSRGLENKKWGVGTFCRRSKSRFEGQSIPLAQKTLSQII
jgi:hypothetical protein